MTELMMNPSITTRRLSNEDIDYFFKNRWKPPKDFYFLTPAQQAQLVRKLKKDCRSTRNIPTPPASPLPPQDQNGIISPSTNKTNARVKNCSFCGKVSETLQPCSNGCGNTRYCNKICEKSHLVQGHRPFCRTDPKPKRRDSASNLVDHSVEDFNTDSDVEDSTPTIEISVESIQLSPINLEQMFHEEKKRPDNLLNKMNAPSEMIFNDSGNLSSLSAKILLNEEQQERNLEKLEEPQNQNQNQNENPIVSLPISSLQIDDSAPKNDQINLIQPQTISPSQSTNQLLTPPQPQEPSKRLSPKPFLTAPERKAQRTMSLSDLSSVFIKNPPTSVPTPTPRKLTQTKSYANFTTQLNWSHLH